MFEPTLPNALTVLRILLIPVLAAALLSGTPNGDLLAASFLGKLKTFAQVAMVLALIVVDGSPAWVDGVVYVTVAITVLSGADDAFGLRRLTAGGGTPARSSSHVET